MGETEATRPELIKFENLSEQDLDSFLGDTVVDETLGSWYYDYVFAYDVTFPYRMIELGLLNENDYSHYYGFNSKELSDEDKQYVDFLEETYNIDTHMIANEIYKNKRIIYYDQEEGCVCMGIIQNVRLISRKKPFDKQMHGKEFEYTINNKKYDYLSDSVMIDHGLSYDGVMPEEIVFGSFDNALKKLKSYNKGEKNGRQHEESNV